MIRRIFLAIQEKTLIEEMWEAIVNKYLTPKYGNYANINIDRDPLVTPAMIFIGCFFAIIIVGSINIFNKRVLGRPVRLLLKNDAIGRKNAKNLTDLGLEKPGVLKFFINRLTLAKAVRCVEEDEFYGIEEETAETTEAATKADETADELLEEFETSLSRRDYKKKLKREKREESRRLSDYKVAEIANRSRNAYYVGAASKIKYKRNIEKDRFYIEDGMQYRAKIRFDTKGANPIILLAIAVGYIIVGVLFIRFLPDLLGFIDGTLGSFK